MAPVTIATSAAATATAYPNQRKIDRCQNGVLWMGFQQHPNDTSSVLTMHYSLDNGATWVRPAQSSDPQSGGAATYTANASFFIDLDDYCHVVYKANANGYIYYRRGTPNAGRTAWTWSAATLIYGDVYMGHPDIVVHRENAGWKAHIIYGLNTGQNYVDSVYYMQVSIASGGTVTTASPINFNNVAQNANGRFPSIDFNHTGDGKTVAGGTPHLYVAWSAGATGTNNGIRFRKATYSGGSWTWGTEREIDNAYAINTVPYEWLNCVFDGTRVMLVFGGDDGYVRSWERDAADTTTTARAVSGPANIYGGSATYDSEGNIWVVGSSINNLEYRKWTRATNTWGATVQTSLGGNVSAVAYATLKRGFSNSRLDLVFTNNSSSPHNVRYESILLPTGGPRMVV